MFLSFPYEHTLVRIYTTGMHAVQITADVINCRFYIGSCRSWPRGRKWISNTVLYNIYKLHIEYTYTTLFILLSFWCFCFHPRLSSLSSSRFRYSYKSIWIYLVVMFFLTSFRFLSILMLYLLRSFASL